MISRIFSWIKPKKDIDARFVDTTNMFYKRTPILLAKRTPSDLDKIQKNEMGENKFHICPGIYEYSNMGYMMTSFCDIYIKANKAGTFVSLGPPGDRQGHGNVLLDCVGSMLQTVNLGVNDDTLIPQMDRNFNLRVSRMDEKIVHGVVRREDGIEPNVWKVDLPYKVVTKNKKMSMLLMPAFYKNPNLLSNIFVYPGNVDFGGGFCTINFVFTITRECEFVIPAGSPILHIIPIDHSKEINVTYGPSNFNIRNMTHYLKHCDNFLFYKRFHSFKKKYTIKEHSADTKTELDLNEK